jgi:hypothetical protein
VERSHQIFPPGDVFAIEGKDLGTITISPNVEGIGPFGCAEIPTTLLACTTNVDIAILHHLASLPLNLDN